MVSLKLRCGDDIRRISIEKNLPFKDLVNQIRIIFAVAAEEDVVIKYLDDEGDKVTLSSDVELREALQYCKEPIQLFITKCPRGTNVSAEPVLEEMDFTLSQLLAVKMKQNTEEKTNSEEERVRLARIALEAKRKEEEEVRKLQAEQKRMQELARLLEQKRDQEMKQRQIEESKLRELKRLEEEERKLREAEEQKRVEEERKRREEEAQKRVKEEELRKAAEEKRKVEEEKRKAEAETEERRKREEERRKAEEEEKRKKEEEKRKAEEEEKRKREEEKRKAEEEKRKKEPVGPKVEAAWVEYKARNGRTVLLDLSSAATARFGVRTYQRVNTPAGPGTVVGVDQEHGLLWFQLDKDLKEGVSYWDDILNYDSLICKGIQPLNETAVQNFIPLPRSTEAILSAIANPSEREMMLQAIQQSLLDQQQQEIKSFYQSLQDAKKHNVL